MLKVVHSEGTIFLAIVRLNLWGYFFITNFFATGHLCEELRAIES